MNSNRDRFFDTSITSIVKGFAIVFMFMLHLLKTEWMKYPNFIIDINIHDTSLSAILSQGGDICIGMFAFVTGYGWAESFKRKHKANRILKPGGVYWTYWIVLVLFSFPMRELFTVIIEDKFVDLTCAEVIRGITAISSKSVVFQWYIYFFALAVLTFEPLTRFINKINICSIVKLYVICIFFIALRFVSHKVFTAFLPCNDALEVVSHYCQWMPVILTGYIVNLSKLYEKLFISLRSKIANNQMTIMLGAMAVFLYVGKCFFIHFTRIQSNFDSLIIPPFMFCIIVVSRWISKTTISKNILSLLGRYSMYLWLTHRFILYQPIQYIVLSLRFPILIIIGSFCIMLPIAFLLSKIDHSTARFVNNRLFRLKMC